MRFRTMAILTVIYAHVNLEFPRVRERVPLFLRHVVLLTCGACVAAASDYATYIGDAYAYTVNAIAVDSSGNTYATGYRSVVISAAGNTANDVFMTKIDPTGNVKLLATLSGKGSDQGNGIAVDGAGNIYVVGMTSSPDFPLFNPLQTVIGQGPFAGTGFIAKLRPDGSIVYSTYIGGANGASALNAVAVDAQGNAYVTGETFASDYPHTTGLPNALASGSIGGIGVAFFAKISPAGDKILYAGGIAGEGHACGTGSTCFTSILVTSGSAIALDPAGSAYIAGNTNGVGLSTTPGALNSTGIGAFVIKVNAAGTALGYSTLLGSANNLPPGGGAYPSSAPGNIVNGIAVDALGDAYITGSTNDPNFPATAGAFQSQPNFTYPGSSAGFMPETDAFVAKLNPSGTAMVWASFLGAGGTAATRIALDASGNVWVTGTAPSSNFPVTSGVAAGGEFVTEFNAAGSTLLYSTMLPKGTAQSGLAMDANGVLHLAGASGLVSTFTPGQSTAARLFGVANAAGSATGMISGRVAPSEAISIYGLHLGVSTPLSATFNSSGFLPTTLGGISVTIGGAPAPLLYVSDTQINAIAPAALTPGAAVNLAISNGASMLAPFRIEVDAAIPGVFLEPNGTAAAINQDGTVNSASNPAPSGSIVSIWATGTGYAPGADGQRATAAQQTCSCVISSQTTNISPTYAGAAPGMVNGIVQINFMVSAGFAPVVQYSLSVDGKTSNPFSVYVSQ
jgi:uncharacterized protein (TIGR03437 family)